MSAVAGFWSFDGSPAVARNCDRMLAAQRMYGPDDGRQWAAGAIALGRRLFRTLPEDAHDRQPLHDRDGRFTLVADVRLDNRDELAAALGLPLGDRARRCDAGILLESLVRWGEGALQQLVGDFAFALWDSRNETLLLARDFVGQRPLHYHCGKDFFAFATMPKGLHALAEVPYGADEQAMLEFVTLIPTDGSRSFFKDVIPVKAGETLTVTRQGVRRSGYWKLAPPPARSRRSDHAEGLRHHLDQATRARLRGAETEVGTHLSAGYDSAAVTATAARLLAPAGGRAVAFTAVPREGYDGPCPPNRIGDEGPLAAATAAMHPNIEHVLIRTGRLSPLEGLDHSFTLFDRPMLNICNLGWARAINAAARERGLTVMLTGQMGNLTLSYGGLEFLAELLRRGRLVRLLREGAGLVAAGGAGWRSVLSHSLGPFIPPPLWRGIGRLLRPGRNVLEHSAVRPERLDDLDRLARKRGADLSFRPRASAFETRLRGLSRTDLGNHNKGMLAGWGLDYRDPTADRRLVEYCLAAPMEAYLANGQTRALARRALADRLPQAVLNARGKGYQAVDWHEGFSAARDEFEGEVGRLSPCGPAAQTLDIERLQALVRNWPDSGWERHDVVAAYRLALGRGVSAGHFLRKVCGGNA
jgi:asparagine synthase (glutamine-hydrolysing)